MTNNEVINCLKTGFFMSGMDNEAISLAIQAIEDVERLKAENKAYRTIIADYKRAEADGLLVRLPCKVGDTVYFILRLTKEYGGTRIVTATVWGIATEKYLQAEQIWLKIDYTDINGDKDKTSCLYGKTAFLTLPEAEQALKELEGTK